MTVYRAKETVDLLKRKTPDFTPPSLWPSNSPDLNPVDYKIWGLLQQRVYSPKIQNVDKLRQRIVEEWERLDQRVIDNAATQSNSGVDVFALVWLRRAEISSK